MRGYKFLSLEFGERVLREKRLKVSSLLSLNDPFDCRATKFPTREDRIIWSKYIEHASKESGIVCFSKSWENPVIWSHYAENAQGVALGFDLPDAGLMEVEYRPDLIISRGWNELDKQAKIDLSMLAFRRKYEHWQYEDEVRYVIKFRGAVDGNGLQFIDFGNDLVLKEVVFGPLFPGKYAKKFRSLSDNYVKYTTTRIAFNTFTVTEQKNKRKQL
ncbi:MAG: hypothetical protein JWS10_2543 [Cypionkella sp.]|uniref:DUF2971 domain-containing protein n=1 Tax=Cypionkella sp. TaxID=2811411 RepID=UPI00260AFAD8|nr:DUF2971 domain-containing protein [Cypionkella sp.]MDB5659928.1 hypothetical protein [Cypionkella sp.]